MRIARPFAPLNSKIFLLSGESSYPRISTQSQPRVCNPIFSRPRRERVVVEGDALPALVRGTLGRCRADPGLGDGGPHCKAGPAAVELRVDIALVAVGCVGALESYDVVGEVVAPVRRAAAGEAACSLAGRDVGYLVEAQEGLLLGFGDDDAAGLDSGEGGEGGEDCGELHVALIVVFYMIKLRWLNGVESEELMMCDDMLLMVDSGGVHDGNFGLFNTRRLCVPGARCYS